MSKKIDRQFSDREIHLVEAPLKSRSTERGANRRIEQRYGVSRVRFFGGEYTVDAEREIVPGKPLGLASSILALAATGIEPAEIDTVLFDIPSGREGATQVSANKLKTARSLAHLGTISGLVASSFRSDVLQVTEYDAVSFGDLMGLEYERQYAKVAKRQSAAGLIPPLTQEQVVERATDVLTAAAKTVQSERRRPLYGLRPKWSGSHVPLYLVPWVYALSRQP